MQTLAHLNAIFKWTPYRGINDTQDILLVDDERTIRGSLSRLLREAGFTVRVAANVGVLRTFAISTVFSGRGVFDRAFLREERHLSAFRALNAENFFAFIQILLI